MTTELSDAIEKIKMLSDEEQTNLAHLILEELSWEQSLSDSSKQLEFLANEAIAEYRKGKTKPLKF